MDCCAKGVLMNILLIGHELSVSGAPNSLLRQACYFRDAGYNVDIISLNDGKLKQRYLEEGFSPIIINDSDDAIRDAYNKQNKKYDFILCNTTVTYKAVDFLQHQQTPLVWFIRETRLVDIGMKTDANFARVFRSFYNIYTVSNYAARVCRKYNKNVKIIYNAVSDKFKKYKPINKTVRFGFIGRIAEDKGAGVLMDAFKQLTLTNPNTELHIAGNYNHEYAQQLKDMNVPHVKWYGEVQKQEKENFFNNIDILIVPSLDEPSGLTVIEGAMYGKPIIATDKTGANYIVKDRVSGFIVKANNAHDLYIRMKDILDCDIAFMQKMSRQMYLKYGTIDRERKSVLKMLKDNKQNIPVINNIETDNYRIATRDKKFNLHIPVIYYSRCDNKTKINILGAQVLKIKRTDIDYVVYVFGIQVFKRHISCCFAKINLFGIRVCKYRI